MKYYVIKRATIKSSRYFVCHCALFHNPQIDSKRPGKAEVLNRFHLFQLSALPSCVSLSFFSGSTFNMVAGVSFVSLSCGFGQNLQPRFQYLYYSWFHMFFMPTHSQQDNPCLSILVRHVYKWILFGFLNHLDWTPLQKKLWNIYLYPPRPS